jgi:hypothetical protein
MHQNQWIGLQEKETKFYMWVKRQVEKCEVAKWES